MIDSSLKMDIQINWIVKSCFFHLRRLFKPILKRCHLQSITQAFNTSCLYFSYSVLYGINSTIVARLQLVQNAVAWFLTGTKRQEHITPVLQHYIGFQFPSGWILRFCYLFSNLLIALHLHICLSSSARMFLHGLSGQLQSINYLSQAFAVSPGVTRPFRSVLPHSGTVYLSIHELNQAVSISLYF